MITNSLMVHPVKYQQAQDRARALEAERDQWQARHKKALAERDAALDAIARVRAFASAAGRSGNAKWPARVLELLAGMS